MSDYLASKAIKLENRTKAANAALAVTEAQIALAVAQKSKVESVVLLDYMADIEIAEERLMAATRECARNYCEGV